MKRSWKKYFSALFFSVRNCILIFFLLTSFAGFRYIVLYLVGILRLRVLYIVPDKIFLVFSENCKKFCSISVHRVSNTKSLLLHRQCTRHENKYLWPLDKINFPVKCTYYVHYSYFIWYSILKICFFLLLLLFAASCFVPSYNNIKLSSKIFFNVDYKNYVQSPLNIPKVNRKKWVLKVSREWQMANGKWHNHILKFILVCFHLLLLFFFPSLFHLVPVSRYISVNRKLLCKVSLIPSFM